MEIKQWIRQDHFDDETPVESEPEWEMITKKNPRFYRLKVDGGWLLYTRESNNVSYAKALEFIEDIDHSWTPTDEDTQKETRRGLPRSGQGSRKYHHHSLKIPGGKVYRITSGGYDQPISMALTKVMENN